MNTNSNIDWTNPQSAVSHWFTVHECLFLPHWGRYAEAADGLTQVVRWNLITLCAKLDKVRDFFGVPMIITSMYRPSEYSKLVGGFATDVHTKGMAADFHLAGIDCDEAKQRLLPSLESLNIRLENNPGGNWLHVDVYPPGVTGRFFNP